MDCVTKAQNYPLNTQPCPPPPYHSIKTYRGECLQDIIFSARLGFLYIFWMQCLKNTHIQKSMNTGGVHTDLSSKFQMWIIFVCEFIFVYIGLSVCSITAGLWGEVQTEAEWRGTTLECCFFCTWSCSQLRGTQNHSLIWHFQSWDFFISKTELCLQISKYLAHYKKTRKWSNHQARVNCLN